MSGHCGPAHFRTLRRDEELRAVVSTGRRSKSALSLATSIILDTADPDLKLLKESQYGKLNLLKAISIDTDLPQLTNDDIVRGTVVSNTIRIAEDGLSCASTTPVDVTRARVVRLFTGFEKGSSLLVTRQEHKQVKVCDSSYQIRTPEGKVISKHFQRFRTLSGAFASRPCVALL